VCLGKMISTWGPPMGDIQRSEMRFIWVLVGSSSMQRQPMGSGSCDILVLLRDPRIQLVRESLHLSMGRVTMEGDPNFS